MLHVGSATKTQEDWCLFLLNHFVTGVIARHTEGDGSTGFAKCEFISHLYLFEHDSNV